MENRGYNRKQKEDGKAGDTIENKKKMGNQRF